MKIKVLTLGLLKINCYLVLTDDMALVIDPGKYDERQKQFLSENEDKQRLILITHAHFDHILGAERLREETGVQIAIGRIEAPSLQDARLNLSDRFRAPLKPFDADILLDDNQVLEFGNTTVKCIVVPGHTMGSMCYLINDTLFSGDTLFYNTIGNTDFPTGDFGMLITALRNLVEILPEQTKVYPGHGEETVIGYEKAYNPFLR